MSEEEIKYSIQKVFGRYSICIEIGTTVESYFDVQENIIKIIKQLEQENQAYKEAIKRCYTPEEIDFEIMPVKAELEAEKDINNNLHKTIDKLRVNLYETQQENTQLKSVLKEIREYIEKHKFAYENPLTRNIYNVSRCDEVLEIIDKGIGEDK